MDSAGHCACTNDPNAENDVNSADLCVCKLYFMPNAANDACVACSGPGAKLEDDECVCDAELFAESIADYSGDYTAEYRTVLAP